MGSSVSCPEQERAILCWVVEVMRTFQFHSGNIFERPSCTRREMVVCHSLSQKDTAW